ncbi:MAG: hypothetical protein U5N86_06600 [Planctomycetota bacterium]|nr:hypothetical protein [Planctomycetota bacterium]
MDDRKRNINMLLGFLGPLGLVLALAALIVMTLKPEAGGKGLAITLGVIIGCSRRRNGSCRCR